jgi:amphi-Trp domain-containing protein
MVKESVDLDFEFSNAELANFLNNFAEKVESGEVGLSFRGREEVEISPTEDNKVDLQFYESNDHRKMTLKIQLKEEIETTSEGRRKIQVEVV